MQVLEIPPELDLKREVILWGQAPTWLYSNLIWRFHEVPWIACFNMHLHAAIVVSSRIPQVQPGDEIPINSRNVLGTAILICGAPDSGKSILSYALQRSLAAIKPDASIFLHRANWDGEGNHTLENPDTNLAKRLKDENKFKIHKHPEAEELLPKYFKYHSEAVNNIRQVVDLALIDVGGMAEKVKKPVIDECSHYIVISRYPDKIQDWHNLCGDKLKPLAVIHSVWENKFEVLRTELHLEIVAGKWERGVIVPDVLLEEILKIL
jgi:CRISPR-associated protein Csx3